MGFFRGARKVLLPFASTREWFNVDQVKQSTDTLVSLVKRYLVPNNRQVSENEAAETFEGACEQYRVDDKRLNSLRRNFLMVSLLFVVFAILSLGYTLFMFNVSSYRAALIALIVTAIACSLAFRYHFWWYQIKTKKLGCTFKEWLHGSWFSE